MSWRNIQKNNFTSIEKLIAFLQLKRSDVKELLQKKRFPLNLPLRLANKIQKGTLIDPILKQYVPTKEEHVRLPGFQEDPVEDKRFCITEKLIQKYTGRVLLLCGGACAMHCRFCFRQNFDYSPIKLGFEKELEWIKEHPEIYEVILSGGDPLSLSDQMLQELIQSLQQIPHVRFIRFHTRFPIGIPERITNNFLQILQNKQKQIVFILHINHPLELDDDVQKAIKDIQKTGTPVLSQTVLLKGVNDQISTLKTLFLRLAEAGILPYYLHQFDPIVGGHHFSVDPKVGTSLIQRLQETLPGYAVPKYVQEIPGKKSKSYIF